MAISNEFLKRTPGAAERAQNHVVMGLSEYENERNYQLESRIISGVATIASLPDWQTPVERDYDALQIQGRILQERIGLSPKPVIFTEDTKAAENFLDTQLYAPNSAWKRNWSDIEYEANKGLEEGYETHLWMNINAAIITCSPDLNLPKKMAAKMQRRFASSVQFLIIEDHMEMQNPFSPFINAAKQRAYILGADSHFLRMYLPTL